MYEILRNDSIVEIGFDFLLGEKKLEDKEKSFYKIISSDDKNNSKKFYLNALLSRIFLELISSHTKHLDTYSRSSSIINYYEFIYIKQIIKLSFKKRDWTEKKLGYKLGELPYINLCLQLNLKYSIVSCDEMDKIVLKKKDFANPTILESLELSGNNVNNCAIKTFNIFDKNIFKTIHDLSYENLITNTSP